MTEEDVQFEQPQPQDEEEEILREDHKKVLRCIECGRHIADVITVRAVVQATCNRKNCKKINRFYIDGNRVNAEIIAKSRSIAAN